MTHKIKFVIKILLVLIVAALCFFYGYKSYLKSAYPIKFYDYVSAASAKYGVEKELIFAVIRTESSFREDAVSRAGAIGLMQITPETFDWLQLNLRPSNRKSQEALKDPEVNIDYGTYLLSILANKYSDETATLCAYNAGISNVKKWLNDPQYSDNKVTLKQIPYKETRDYVARVKKSKKVYKSLYF